jgi:tellurite resistance protein
MKFIDYDEEELYREVRVKAEAEGAFDHESWKGAVEDVLALHAEFAEIEEQEMIELRENLVSRFADFEEDEQQA